VTFQKGPDYFVEAAQKALKNNANLRFVKADKKLTDIALSLANVEAQAGANGQKS
jgi:hypothetical protein